MNMLPQAINLLCRWLASAPDDKEEEETWQSLDPQSRVLLMPLREAFQSQQERWKSQQERLEFFQAMLKNLPAAIFAKDAEGRFIFFNRACEKLFAVKSGDILGKTVHELDLLPSEDCPLHHAEDMEEAGKNCTNHREITLSRESEAARSCLYWSCGFHVPGTGQRGLVGSIVDISGQKAAEQALAKKIAELKNAKARIEELNRTDPLTGLFNRRYFDETFAKAVILARRHRQPLSLIMLDLDHFKKINDTYGHTAGDEVLQKFSEILRNSCRTEDTIARVGGEEFLIILPLTDLDNAVPVAERIRHEVEASTFSSAQCRVTTSAGVAQILPHEEAQDMLQRVDKTLYAAKRHGRNRVEH